MPLDLTHSLFSEQLNETFRLSLGSESLDLKLTECNPIDSPSGKSQGREPFSLTFRGPKSPILVQRIYRIENEQLGVLEIFLVPIGPDGEGQRYEAVFN
jgi:hypothetical protein